MDPSAAGAQLGSGSPACNVAFVKKLAKKPPLETEISVRTGYLKSSPGGGTRYVPSPNCPTPAACRKYVTPGSSSSVGKLAELLVHASSSSEPSSLPRWIDSAS